ncbi:glycosyltransferase [Amylibacter sp. SFDW26]|uniref:glycosyltransferase family 2 protein n=1 Tax=Amylibacter sp. SFDW26 TaxID=2652722 RepID=UPI00126172B6|nr:cellulose synthase catalytic subunit [Amylibacter sp. SFDW26]KAB7613484.1 glycosyltransferase [Amylibacter sp. SFDW26]
MQNGIKIEERFRERQKLRIFVAVLFICSSGAYLFWRLTIFNGDALILSSIFYTAEIIGVIISLGAIFSTTSHRYRASPDCPEGKEVDVFIPTYKEPYDVIRRTVQAAVNIKYPHQTIILDDGKNVAVKKLADELGCFYLSRDENHNAKAGNLNFGLAHSKAEFVMVFDADHIPKPNAIHALLGFLEDPEVALAQAPQDFYNSDCLQFVNGRNGELWHDQSYFYHIAMPNSDHFNATTCIGTNVIYRRSALDDINGIPTDTVTEDLHTSLKLHKKGYKTAFHNESIAYGLGEFQLSDFYKVRLRWGHGNIHVLRHENLFFCKGLTLRQRIAYLLVGLNHIEGWQYLIFYLLPIYSLFTGVAPFEVTILNILIMLIYPIFTYALVQEFACGYGRFWVNELYSMMRFPIAIIATFAVFRNKMSWRYSKKVPSNNAEWLMMTPQLSVVCLSIVAILYACISNWNDLEVGVLTSIILNPSTIVNIDINAVFKAGFNSDLILIASLWAMLNIARGFIFVRKILYHSKNTFEDHRFSIPLIAELSVDGKVYELVTSKISMSFVSFETAIKQASHTTPIDGKIYFPNGSARVTLNAFYESQGALKTDFSLSVPDQNERKLLEDALYSTGWQRDTFNSNSDFTTPLSFIRQGFKTSIRTKSKCAKKPFLIEETNCKKVIKYHITDDVNNTSTI